MLRIGETEGVRHLRNVECGIVEEFFGAGYDGVDNQNLPSVDNQFVINICWFNPTPMQLRKKYIVRHATQEVQGLFTEIDFRVDISKQERITGVNELQLNDIAQVKLKTAAPLVFEPYKQNKVMGSLIFIDPFSFETVGAGMIV